MKRKRQKTRDPVARALRTPKFRVKVIPDKRNSSKYRKTKYEESS